MNRLFSQMLNGVTCGDCIDVMAHLPGSCVDFVLTDPPYLEFTAFEGLSRC
jgi:DNA modification methylase